MVQVPDPWFEDRREQSYCATCAAKRPFTEGKCDYCAAPVVCDEVTVPFDALAHRLRDEYDALGMMSYSGGQPDMCVPDIEQIRDLIRDAGSALRAAARVVAAAEDLPLWRLDADLSDGEFDAVTRFRRSLLLVDRAANSQPNDGGES